MFHVILLFVIHTCIYTCILTDMHIYIYMHIHIYIHTYILHKCMYLHDSIKCHAKRVDFIKHPWTTPHATPRHDRHSQTCSFFNINSYSIFSSCPRALLTFISKCSFAKTGLYLGGFPSSKHPGMHSMTASGFGL